MKLTDSAVKNAKPNPPKTRKLFDGRGLYIESSLMPFYGRENALFVTLVSTPE